MLVDIDYSRSLAHAAESAQRAERQGYDGLWTGEADHDPFLPLLLAAGSTERISLGTAIAIAFARTPMTAAYTAWDLHTYSGGRFVLGLGSQVKPHIEHRFSMPWSRPAARMREFVLALHAIWGSWQEGTKLDFRGEFYTHTLMPPFFAPRPNDLGVPRVLLAGVGEQMTAVAGEVADGLVAHPFTTERYLREVTLPTIRAARTNAQRDGDPFEVKCSVFVVTGKDDEALASAVTATRKQIAFYGSTPAYRSVLELHGWGDLQTALTTLSRRGAWDEMGDLIDDDVLAAFAVVGPPDDAVLELVRRYAGALDRISFYAPYRLDPELADHLAAGVSRAS